MRKVINGYLFFALILAVLFTGFASTAQAEVNVSINFGPPPIVVSAPPEVVMMPGMGIYFVPGISYDVFFYNGYWWAQRGDGWYRSASYNRGWAKSSNIPSNLRRIPKNYRSVYHNQRPIKYEQWKGGHDRGGNNKGRGNKH